MIPVLLAMAFSSCAVTPKRTAPLAAAPPGMVKDADGTLYLAKNAPASALAVVQQVSVASAPAPDTKSRKTGRIVGNVLMGVLIGLGEGASAYSASQPQYTAPSRTYGSYPSASYSNYSDVTNQFEMNRLNRSIHANTDAINNLNYSTRSASLSNSYRPVSVTPFRPAYRTPVIRRY